MEYAIRLVYFITLHEIQQVIIRYPYLAVDESFEYSNNIVNGIDKSAGNRNTIT